MTTGYSMLCRPLASTARICIGWCGNCGYGRGKVISLSDITYTHSVQYIAAVIHLILHFRYIHPFARACWFLPFITAMICRSHSNTSPASLGRPPRSYSLALSVWDGLKILSKALRREPVAQILHVEARLAATRGIPPPAASITKSLV
jgi:hypothetical protein